jgi:hypothetical protein
MLLPQRYLAAPLLFYQKANDKPGETSSAGRAKKSFLGVWDGRGGYGSGWISNE